MTSNQLVLQNIKLKAALKAACGKLHDVAIILPVGSKEIREINDLVANLCQREG